MTKSPGQTSVLVLLHLALFLNISGASLFFETLSSLDFQEHTLCNFPPAFFANSVSSSVGLLTSLHPLNVGVPHASFLSHLFFKLCFTLGRIASSRMAEILSTMLLALRFVFLTPASTLSLVLISVYLIPLLGYQ